MGLCSTFFAILIALLGVLAYFGHTALTPNVAVPTLGTEGDPLNIKVPLLWGPQLKLAAQLLKNPTTAPVMRRAHELATSRSGLRALADQVKIDMDTKDWYPLHKMTKADRMALKAAQLKLPSLDAEKSLAGMDDSFTSSDRLSNTFMTGGGQKDLGASREVGSDILKRLLMGKTKPAMVMEVFRLGTKQQTRKLHFMGSRSDEILKLTMMSAYTRWEWRIFLSILDSVPIVFSDDFHMRGFQPLYGRKAYEEDWDEGWDDEDDEELAAKKRVANLENELDPVFFRSVQMGLSVFGSAVIGEDGIGYTGYNAHYQGPLNPYNRGRMAGGPHGGPAVAVASGAFTMAVSHDMMGSGLLPAAWNGIFALRTTFGALPVSKEKEQNKIRSYSLFGGTSVDVAVLYLAVGVPHFKSNTMLNKAGEKVFDVDVNYTDWTFYNELMWKGDPEGAKQWDHHADGTDVTKHMNHVGDNHKTMYDSGPLPHPVVYNWHKHDDLSQTGTKVGVIKELMMSASPEMRTGTLQMVKLFKEFGAEVVEVSVPHLRWLTMAGELLASHYREEELRSAQASSSYVDRLDSTEVVRSLARGVEQRDVDAALKLAMWTERYVKKLFKKHDLTVMLAPSVDFIAPEQKFFDHIDLQFNLEVTKGFVLPTLTGMPAMQVPVGHDPETLMPLGMTMIAKHWHEHELIRLAYLVDEEYLLHGEGRLMPRQQNFWYTKQISLKQSRYMDPAKARDPVSNKIFLDLDEEDGDDEDWDDEE